MRSSEQGPPRASMGASTRGGSTDGSEMMGRSNKMRGGFAMSIIDTPDEADDSVADLYGPEVAELGYVPSHTRAMAVNPEAFRAFQQLVRTIVSQLGLRRFELATLAAAN